MNDCIDPFHGFFKTGSIHDIIGDPFYFFQDGRRYIKGLLIAAADSPDRITFFNQLPENIGSEKAGAACDEYRPPARSVERNGIHNQ
jgi:hypothetical protein